MHRLTIIMILVALLLVGCSQDKEEKTDNGFSGVREVLVVEASSGDISSYIQYTGKAQAREVVNISPSLPLKINEILVKEGDPVEEGDLLLVMDRAVLIQAEQQYLNLKKSFSRIKELRSSGSIDQQSFDDIQTAYEVARANYQSVLENTEIRAPFKGTVSYLALKEGDSYNNMLEPTLIRIVNLRKIEVNLQVSEKDMVTIEKGQKALIKVDARSDLEFPGKVSFVSPEADQFTGLFPVRLFVDNSYEILKHNQFVRIKLLTATSRNTIIIPQQAIINDNTVYIVEDGRAVLKEVQTGLETEDQIEIRSGIKQGDLVIIEGNIGLNDGEMLKYR
ncbi:MAG: efflux RND transporter periplasmic adaptor subunit [Candidatus Cloacimonetes bacterium]|nr:efflux RND transporter periplasmic adaptor subunit [Candidatus Cloacimonadota bacterium]